MNRVIFSSIISLLLIAALAVGYFYYEGYTENKTYPESALPPDAAFFIKGSLNNLMHDLNSMPFWKNPDSTSFLKVLRSEINMLSDFIAVESATNYLSENNNSIISFQFTGVDKVDALFILPVKKDLNINALTDFMKGKNARVSENGTREFAGINIYELNFPDEKKQFTYAFSSGIFIGSFTSYLVEDAIRQQNSGKVFGGDKVFASLYNAKSVKGDYVFCTHYPKFKNFIAAFIAQDKLYKLNDVDNWAEWSVQHILISKEKIVADGFISNRDKNFISSAFEDCGSQKITVTEILPASTNAFQTFAFSNCKQWLDNYRSKIAENEIVKSSKENLKEFERNLGVNITEKFIDIILPEITLAVSGLGTSSYENNLLAFVKLKEPKNAEATLMKLSILASDKKNKKIQFEEFLKHKIGLLPVDGLMPAVFGNSFASIKKGYYTTHQNYLVVANKVSTLRAYIDEVEGNKLLQQNKKFTGIANYIENKCNYLLYADVASSIPLWHELANEKNLFITGEKQDYFKSFGSFLYMAANGSQNNIDCRTVITLTSSASNMGLTVDWNYISDTAIAKGPFVIADENNDNRYILFQDSTANLVCLNETGTMLWQQPVDGFIQGTINAVNYFDSASVQFLFSAGNKIYLLNADGSPLGNYPIKLPSPAVNGIYIDKNMATYFVPCINNRLYVYELTARPAKGWEYVPTNALVSTPVYFASINAEVFIYFADASGELYLYNSRGKRIIKTYLRQPAAGNHLSVRADSTISILTSDSTGTLYTYRQDNSVSIRSTDYAGKILFYANENLLDDNLLEHIIVREHNLTVLKNDLSLAFKFDSKDKLDSQAEIIIAGNKKYILLSDIGENSYLINGKGKKVNGFPVKGSVVSYCIKEKKIVLFVREDKNTIKSYKIED